MTKQQTLMIDEPNSLLLLSTTDAEIWAQEFVKVVKQRPDLAYDLGFVVAWFANAIETAKAYAERGQGGCTVETL